jgi:hypothetical protein
MIYIVLRYVLVFLLETWANQLPFLPLGNGNWLLVIRSSVLLAMKAGDRNKLPSGKE